MYSDIKLISKTSREVNQLSFIQRLACKLFKIKAEKDYVLIIKFTCNEEDIHPSDVVLIPLLNIRMFIRSRDLSGIFTAESMSKLSKIPEVIGDKLLRLCSAYSEV